MYAISGRAWLRRSTAEQTATSAKAKTARVIARKVKRNASQSSARMMTNSTG